MFCAAMIVAGTCMQVCGADPDEYLSAWGQPRWDNAAQAMVDDLGPMPQLYRYNGAVLWMTETEPVLCAPVPRLKQRVETDPVLCAPVPRLKPHEPGGNR